MQVTDGNIGIYFSSFGQKGDLVLELNDERIKKSELDTISASGGRGGSGIIHIRGVKSASTVPTINDQQFCIEVESSPEKCNEYGTGDDIFLYHNNIEKATIPRNFKNFSFCLPLNYVDIENDKFKMQIRGKDSVSRLLCKIIPSHFRDFW